MHYVKENVKGGVNFSLQIIVKRFFKVILSFSMCVARHAQITQNKKFAISLQYLKKEVNHEVDFLHAGKHENFLQIQGEESVVFTFPYQTNGNHAMELSTVGHVILRMTLKRYFRFS